MESKMNVYGGINPQESCGTVFKSLAKTDFYVII